MPRSGVNGTYNLPPNTNNQAPNTPISSSMFNAFASDVQQTFNDPTPIAYGGTGQAELVLPSDEFGIKDGSNGTKRVDFDLSGISASTTRTLTIQDSDGTIALLSDISSLQQDVSDLLNGAVRGDVDQTGKDATWRDQVWNNLGGAPIGVGQTWQDVTSSRAAATTYTNTTGRPIMVVITAGSSASNVNSTLTVDDVAVVPAGAKESRAVLPAVVPDGSTYRFVTASNISSWAELR